MKLAIIGTGYVGLVTGTCFAEKGNKVICVDNDKAKLARLQKGEIPIFEPGLADLVKKNFESENLTFTDDLKFATQNSDIIFFCLPTPTLEDGTSDTRYVFGVAKEIGKFFNQSKIIVNKSTVPIGTTEKIVDIISQDTTQNFAVVSNPEFLREGFAVADFMQPDRVVIGSENFEAADILKKLYLDFVEDESQVLIMDSRSSEMSKYAANSFLATKVTFINEIANLCYKLGANVDFVKDVMGMDPRIGKRFLNPGLGLGGSCFPKDIKALKTTSQENDYHFRLLSSTIQANEAQISSFTNRIINYFKQENLPKKVAVWGLTFKPNTDDLRESPALKVIQKLQEKDFQINAYDPEGMENLKNFYPDLKVKLGLDKYSILQDTSCLIIATEWEEFLQADLTKVKEILASPIIFDGRNIFKIDNPNLKGLNYFSVGRVDKKL